MFWTLLSIEHTKVFRRYILRIEIILLCVFLGVVYLLNLSSFAYAQSKPEYSSLMEEEKATITWPNFLGFSASFGSMFGAVLVIILVGGTTAQEYSSRTVSLQVGHGTPRLLFLPAKFLSFPIPIFCLVLSPVLVGGALSAAGTVYLNGGIDLSQVDFPHLAISIVGIWYSLLPCAAFTFLLAVLTRSTAAAIGIGMGYFLIAENFLAVFLMSLGNTYAVVAKHLPGMLAGNLNSIIEDSINPLMGSSPPGLTATVVGIGAYTLVFFLLSALIFRRQDLSAG
jgi:ABC-2 type transport system permease protein